MQRSALEKKILQQITPSKRPPAMMAKVLAKLRAAIARRQHNATVLVGGSTAKGTNLKGDHDVDVFVRFSPDYDDERLADILGEVLNATFRDVHRVHGSRDYFHVQLGAYLFEFVPVLNISSWEEARNVTDMSPLHVDYVRRKIAMLPSLADDIRLTKQFCKAARVYGAESYIGGFSGHVIDLLNIYYSGFRELLAAAAAWKSKVVIDPERRLDNPLTQLNFAKTLAPLVIVDPVQPDRNSAAALSPQAFAKFRAAAKEYLQNPAESFFRITPLDVRQIRREHKDAEIICVTLVPLDGKKDVVGAKCFKVYQFLLRNLLGHGFALQESRWEFTPQKAVLVFVLPKQQLPKDMELEGPPVHRTEDVARFAKAHTTTFTRGGKVHALEPRRHRTPVSLLKVALQDHYVRERVRKATIATTS
jgi:tRNA nucleotidyltransferase (CCA-adding enzyme)